MIYKLVRQAQVILVKKIASFKFIVLVSSVQHNQHAVKTRRLDIIVAGNIPKFYLVVFRQAPRQDLSAHRMSYK